jgi:hypothetical protein
VAHDDEMARVQHTGFTFRSMRCARL